MRLNNIFSLIVALLLTGSIAVFAQTAKVQVIHNSPDDAAAEVDIYLNDNILLDNFAYKTATPFVDVPANEMITISIAPASSKGVNDAIASYDYTLDANSNYIIVAAGLLNLIGATTPGAFDLKVFDSAKLLGMKNDITDVLVFHGSPDAPMVDIKAISTGIGTPPLVDNIAFGEFAGYLGLPTADYALEIFDESGQKKLLRFDAALKSLNLGGQAALVLASGLFNNETPDNGKDFGLWVVLPNGTYLDLRPLTISDDVAQVQVVHNSPDMLASEVDIYLDGALLLNDFAYKSATPFVEVPANQEITINVAPSTSTSVKDAIAEFKYTLAANNNYILIASGLLDENSYTNFKPFDIKVFDQARISGSKAGNTDILIYHGSTDAPAVDINLTAVDPATGPLVNDLKYGEYAGYLSVPTTDYLLSITDETGQKQIYLFDAALGTLGLDGQAITVVATGFVSETSLINDRGFGLLVVLADGNSVFLPKSVTGVEDNNLTSTVQTYQLSQNYPNPFNPTTTINYSIPEAGNVTLKIYNITGSEVTTLVNETMSAGSHSVKFDAGNFASGVYIYELRVNSFVQMKKMNLLK